MLHSFCFLISQAALLKQAIHQAISLQMTLKFHYSKELKPRYKILLAQV